jgi:hypothetical protein
VHCPSAKCVNEPTTCELEFASVGHDGSQQSDRKPRSAHLLNKKIAARLNNVEVSTSQLSLPRLQSTGASTATRRCKITQ